jgi:hypothetical protein
MAGINVRTCCRESVAVRAVVGRLYGPDELLSQAQLAGIIKNQRKDIIFPE